MTSCEERIPRGDSLEGRSPGAQRSLRLFVREGGQRDVAAAIYARCGSNPVIPWLRTHRRVRRRKEPGRRVRAGGQRVVVAAISIACRGAGDYRIKFSTIIALDGGTGGGPMCLHAADRQDPAAPRRLKRGARRHLTEWAPFDKLRVLLSAGRSVFVAPEPSCGRDCTGGRKSEAQRAPPPFAGARLAVRRSGCLSLNWGVRPGERPLSIA
jgi:hypothetical protein